MAGALVMVDELKREFAEGATPDDVCALGIRDMDAAEAERAGAAAELVAEAAAGMRGSSSSGVTRLPRSMSTSQCSAKASSNSVTAAPRTKSDLASTLCIAASISSSVPWPASSALTASLR